MKILVISLAGIGDTLLATPLVHELRANFPGAQLDAFVLWPGSRDLLEGNPHLNAVYQKNLLKESRAESLRFLAPLRRARYDLSINTHPQSRLHYRLTSRFIGATLRLSHEYECSGLLDRWLVNRSLPQTYQKHSVENNLDLLGLLDKRPVLPAHKLEVVLGDTEREWAENFIRANDLGQRPRLGVHVGSGGTKNLKLKRWPLEHYIELLKRVRQTWPEMAVLLFGGPEEDSDLRQVIGAVGSPWLVRVRSNNLRQAGALIKECTAFLSVDTALMHLAAAVQTRRQFVIEAPTFNKTNEPYGNPFVLIRNPVVAGRNLEYYRYDGAGIKGSREELLRSMASVSVAAVLESMIAVLEPSS